MKKYVLLFILTSLFVVSCEKFLEPEPEGRLTEDMLLGNPSFAEGLLMTAYSLLPNSYTFPTDVASDDAVTNDKGSAYRRMATGEWTSSFNPISKWASAYKGITYINKFLDIYKEVKWANDVEMSDTANARKNKLHLERLTGEAYGMRAWFQYELLQYHAGKSGGELKGYPILKKTLKPDDDWKLPRNTFAECVASIFADLDTAIAYLPPKWEDTGDAIYNAAKGARFENRINGNAARALKSRVALLAASPAFSEAHAVSWEEAATIAGNLLADLGPLYNKGVTFYTEASSPEIIWNQAQRQRNDWENNNFPPSLFGLGMTDPSQNLVDAFPMANGYPIDHDSSGYDPDNPYSNRDPRFYQYILYNTSIMKKDTIYTFLGALQDGINSLVTSTRTGYYLKKFMLESVNLTPGSSVEAMHNYTLIRMTEVLLNFAEAANEAWGPDGDPNGYGFTARSKIEELRARAGIPAPDDYLNSITDKNEFRKLIHNERRIELCFEGFRFWDIRRWNDQTTLTTPVEGVYIGFNNDSTAFVYDYKNIEDRIFTPDMIYGPIPYNETLKYDIEQNNGW